MNSTVNMTPATSRMLDDFAFLTYPLHFFVNMIKSVLMILFVMAAIAVSVLVWMVTAHDNRAQEIKNFSTEQTVYAVNLATGRATIVKQGHLVDSKTFSANFNDCAGTDAQLKNNTWFDHRWLADKSDMFQGAYIVASHNIAALNFALSRVKADAPVTSFRNACIYGNSKYVTIPNAPIVNIAFLEQTDNEIRNPAGAQYNYFTGMCVSGSNCTTADYSPRNDSIYADAVYHQVTDNQAHALKALYDTGSPEFWIAAAHANGIHNDALIADYAAQNKAVVAEALQHVPTYEEQFQHELYIAGLFAVVIFGLLFWWSSREFKKVVEAIKQSRPAKK